MQIIPHCYIASHRREWLRVEIHDNQICVLKFRHMDFEVGWFIQLLKISIYTVWWFTITLAGREFLTVHLGIFLFYYTI